MAGSTRADAPDYDRAMPDFADLADGAELLVVDDHPLVCAALVQALEQALGKAGAALRCEAAASAAEARRRLERPPPPDVVLADFRLPDGDGIALLQDVRRLAPRAACIVLSGLDDPRLPARAQALGFEGYLSKSLQPAQLVAGVQAVLQGRRCFPQPAAEAGVPVLTERQAEVLSLVGRGRSNKEIARALGVAERTVKDHLTIVFARLAVHTRAEAVARAGALGLIRLQ
jgi:DNA-binding NarL/FixJ family response regulator